MGSGIAAHCANAGIPVLLLDIVPPKTRAATAVATRSPRARSTKLRKAKPAAFMTARNELLVSIGNFDDDLAKVKDCDLIIEAVVERLDIKRALFEKLEKLARRTRSSRRTRRACAIADMLVGRSEAFRKNFMVTHFFNPPRYMKLLELVAGPDTSAEANARRDVRRRTCSARASCGRRTRRTSSATASACTR